MKLGTLKSSSRDGSLVVVSKDNKRIAPAGAIAPHLRSAVENWGQTRPRLQEVYNRLNEGKGDFQELKEEDFLSPLPRAFQWIDGSAFIQHVKLVRKSRNAPLPETLETSPLVYQGGGDQFLGPREDIPQRDPSHGTDFEGEAAVVLNDTPMGVDPQSALKHIILFMLTNDVSLRALAPEELKKGFGFLQSKPPSAFAPFAVTQEELGESWKEGRIHLPLLVDFNGKSFGRAFAGQMHFHFGELIAHSARTRPLSAGTIIGSGTVSNDDPSKGSSCLVEKRMLEKIETGAFSTPFMKPGDRVEMKMKDSAGNNIFGSICQKVKAVPY